MILCYDACFINIIILLATARLSERFAVRLKMDHLGKQLEIIMICIFNNFLLPQLTEKKLFRACKV